MGWNRVENYELKIKNQKTVFKNVKQGAYFYFVHSYYCVPENVEAITATTEYVNEFASAVQWRNFYGVQFHPEKSGKVGLKVLKNFCEL